MLGYHIDPFYPLVGVIWPVVQHVAQRASWTIRLSVLLRWVLRLSRLCWCLPGLSVLGVVYCSVPCGVWRWSGRVCGFELLACWIGLG